jgi:hypothetical protein
MAFRRPSPPFTEPERWREQSTWISLLPIIPPLPEEKLVAVAAERGVIGC